MKLKDKAALITGGNSGIGPGELPLPRRCRDLSKIVTAEPRSCAHEEAVVMGHE